MNKLIKCPGCGGNGLEGWKNGHGITWAVSKCIRCNGTGRIKVKPTKKIKDPSGNSGGEGGGCGRPVYVCASCGNCHLVGTSCPNQVKPIKKYIPGDEFRLFSSFDQKGIEDKIYILKNELERIIEYLNK